MNVYYYHKFYSYQMEQTGAKTFASQFLSLSRFQTTFQRLIMAIKNNRIDLLASIPSSPEDFKEKDENDKNLLFYALYEKNPTAFLFLLRQGVDSEEKDKQNKSLYHFGGYSGSIDCLKTLHQFRKLEKIMKLNNEYMEILKKSNYKRTDMKNGVLKLAVSAKRKQVFQEMQESITKLYEDYLKNYLQTLLQSFKEIDENMRRTPFHLVCLNKYQKCLLVLEDFISQISSPDLNLTPKVISEYVETDKYDKKNIDPRLYEDALSLVSDVVLPEKKEKIWKVYESEAKKGLNEILEMRDKDDHTPLYISSKNGSTAMINLLQKHESKIKVEDQEEIMKIAQNNLARSHIIDLCEASKLSDTKPLNFLLSCGEEVNKKKSIFGTFALLEAVKNFAVEKYLQPIKVLLKSGADVNEQDTNGWTVFHHACHQGSKEILQLLIEQKQKSKLNINVFTNKRYHALHLAALANHSHIISYLVEDLAVNVNVRDWNQCAPLHHASKKGCFEALKTLLEQKADIYACDIQKMTALHYAAIGNNSACVKELISADADNDKLREIRNTKGKMAKDLWNNTKVFQNIFTAARKGDVNTIRKLISENQSLKDSVTPIKQRTPLIMAIIAKSLISVKYLVENGADQYHEDKDGRNARWYGQQLVKQVKGGKTKEEKEKEKSAHQILSMLD